MTPPLVSSIPAASAISLSNGSPQNIVSLVLAPGNWLCWANLDVTLTGATLTALIASLSLSTGALASQGGQNIGGNRLYQDGISQLLASLTTVTGTQSVDCGATLAQVLPGQTPTLYLVGQASFSAGSVAAFGSLFALALPAG
jgi:hypothetical protein